MAKLEKILEACENFKLESEVALLESTELTELVRAQSKLMIHENMNYIKNALTKGKVLEETQNLLADAWTQVICEDIDLDSIAGGAQGAAHGIAGVTGGLIGAAQGGNLGNVDYKNIPGAIHGAASAGYNQGYNPDANIGDTYDGVKFVGENPGLATAAGVGALGAGTYGAMKAIDSSSAIAQGARNQMGSAAAGATGTQGPVKPGTQTAYNVGAAVNKVKRAFGK